jgi:hypothetical protein
MKRMLLVLAMMLTCTGCIHVSTLITLKPDGSGTMDEEIGMNPQALSMLAAFGGGGRGAQSGPKLDDLFNEQKAREQAQKMGVRFVSGAPVETPSLKGYRARYAFDDIKALKVRMQEADAMHANDGSHRDPFDFDFTKGPSSSTLTIRIPQDLRKPPMAQFGGGGNAQVSQEQGQQMLAMMRPMLAGMFVDVSVAVDGQIVHTNAPFVEGNRVTLVQLDMDKVIGDDAAWTRLQKATTPADMKNIPGVKMSVEPTLTIEFRR